MNKIPIVLIVKILLLIACAVISVRIILINSAFNEAILEQREALRHYKNDPLKNAAENKIIYLETHYNINKRIAALEQERPPNWYGYIPFILSLIGGWLLRDIRRTLFKKKEK